MIKLIEILSIIGILGMGYLIGRIIEAWLIGSWNYPKKSVKGEREMNKEELKEEQEKLRELRKKEDEETAELVCAISSIVAIG